MNPELKKRLLSFAWQTGVMIILLVIAQVTKLLPTLGLPETVTVIVGLLLNQATKYLNTKYQVGKAILGAFKR